jgi:hypothetical protein
MRVGSRIWHSCVSGSLLIRHPSPDINVAFVALSSYDELALVRTVRTTSNEEVGA